MSGLAGFAGYCGHDAPGLLDRMSSSIRRSPLRVHHWGNGSAGISVADHKESNEPKLLFNEDHSVCLAMNGEVFGFDQERRELMAAGHLFNCETNGAEYCLHLYEEKGPAAFRDLNGDFALVLFDLKKETVFLISDKFSSYALFYSLAQDGTLLFSSHVASIAESTLIGRELDVNAIFEYFSFAQIFTTRTFLKNVRMLAPASVLQYRQGKVVTSTYWQMRYQEENQSDVFFAEKLSHVLKQAVSRRMGDDLRHGLLLSGGLDSRMLLAAADRAPVCFTFGDYDNREVRVARRLSGIRGARHFFLKRDPDHYANLIDEAVDIGDGMSCFTNAHGLGFFEAIRNECDALWHGYAVERYFRGTYLPRTSVKLLGEPLTSRLAPLAPHRLRQDMRERSRTSLLRLNPSRLFQAPCARRLDEALGESLDELIAEALPCCSDVHDVFIWLNTRYSREFAFLSVTSVRAYMKERSIALDNDMIDLHLSMPFRLRSNSGVWMKAMNRLNPAIARVINANTGGPMGTPEIVGWALKMGRKAVARLPLKKESLPYGSAHPTRAWPDFELLLKFSPKMQKEMGRVISDTDCLPGEIFDVQHIGRIYEAYMRGRREYAVLLYLLLTFGKWHERYAREASAGVSRGAE